MSIEDTLYKEFPLLNNVCFDPRLIGFQAGQISFISGVSSPRVDMYANHDNQTMVVDSAEFAAIFSGVEQNKGEYEHTKSRRDQDIWVIGVVPKYPHVMGPMQIKHNPSLTVVYIGKNDNKINYLTIESFTRCSDGFGYANVFENVHLFSEAGNYIPKETRLVTSPGHKNGLYCQGINVNVAYMTWEETIEDAMAISQSVADRLQTTEIHTVNITIGPDQYPLNLYGDETEVKFFPDIGETVNAAGILCAFRSAEVETFIPDTTMDALGELQTHDTAYHTPAPPGARVIDVTVRSARNSRMPRHLYAQVDKYIAADIKYWKEIINIYVKYRQTHESTPAFIGEVNRAIQRLIAAGERVDIPGIPRRSKTQLIGKNNRPIEFLELSITYMMKRPCEVGFKITGKDGMKGIIGKILPDDCMPIDDNGMRAGLVIDPTSSIARMTSGPIYEQAINRVSEFVRRKIEALYPTDPPAAAAMLFDYYNDINPNYAAAVRQAKSTPQEVYAHVEDCINDKIHLWIPCGLKTIGLELIQKLKNKWDVPITPVTFTQLDMDGNKIGTFRTKKPVCIGSKYLLLLSKLPEPSSACVSHINQYNVPMKPRPSDKHKYPIRCSPIKFIGEDEGRIVGMDLEDIAELVRIMCLQATSRIGVDAVVDTLLTSEFPTRILRIPLTNTELMNSSTVLRVFNHMLTTMGLGISTKGPSPILKENKDHT